MTLHTSKNRIARYPLEHCPEDRCTFALDVRKGVLASRLSIKPEAFSRLTKQLTRDGIISVHGAHITIVDRNALTRLAGWDDAADLGVVPCPVSRQTRP
ncbi:MAG: helix-turn-helix domain-containing protein [Thiohalocapsa sp.]